jgi:hypothetical protein
LQHKFAGEERGRMIFMQKGKAILLLSGMILGLAGCGQKETSDISSVSVEKDGTITHQIVGYFEQNYYDADSLEELATERIEEYCEDQSEGAVSLLSVEQENSKVSLSLQYASPEDYSGFNNRTLYVGTLEEAKDLDYDLEKIAFISTKNEPEELGAIEEPDQKQIVIIATKAGEELLVNTYGKVLYINQSADSDMEVSVDGKKSVHIINPASEDESSEQEELSYIIFE